MPATTLHTIPITRLFAVWGLDMVGPLKRTPSRFTHLLVAVNKFTKWVEAKPIRKLDKDHAGDPWSFVPIFHSESTR
jgi:hypothetical protein